MQYLQNQPNLLPQQQQLLHQLQMQLRHMQQHQRQQQQQAAALQQAQHQQQLQQQQQQQRNQQESDLLSELQNKDLSNVSDKDLEALISQQDFGSFAESLLKEMQADGVDSADNLMQEDSKEGVVKQEAQDQQQRRRSEDTKVSTLDIPTEVETVKHCKRKTLKVNAGMKATEILSCCQSLIQSGARFSMSTSLLPETCPPPSGPEKPIVKLSKEQLLPPTPSVYLDNKKDAFSPQLQEFCLQHPITVVRGIAAALKLSPLSG